jgi:hypothetical protein
MSTSRVGIIVDNPIARPPRIDRKCLKDRFYGERNCPQVDRDVIALANHPTVSIQERAEQVSRQAQERRK